MAPVELTHKSITKAKSDVGKGRPRYEIRDSRQPNLVMRVGARGVQWQLRLSLRGKEARLPLGGIDEWKLAEARELGSRAGSMLRNGYGMPDEAWVHKRRIEYGKVESSLAAEDRVTLPRPRGWTFREARAKYLETVERTRRSATFKDYRYMLHLRELAHLENEPVANIPRVQLAEIAAAIHARGVERHAEHLADVLRPMWKWLGEDARTKRSGVQPGVMTGLRAPERTLREDEDEERSAYVPPMLEVGRILAIARAHVLNEMISDAVELMVFTAQRRRTIVTARKDHFRKVQRGGVWTIPPPFRKTGRRKRKKTAHVIPLPPEVWRVVVRTLNNSPDPASPWLFPQFRAKKAGGPVEHMSESTLTRALLLMPGVQASPHDLRRAFATHGEATYGLKRSDTKAILDHDEGEQSNDVTRTSYALHDGTYFKWSVMQTWCKATESQVRRAVEADPRLTDWLWLKSEIDRARYVRSE